MIANYIAVLVRDLQKAVDALPSFCEIQDREKHEADGMLEQYVSIEATGASLLLVEPLGEGPYASALLKRGPGLHHLGCVTSSLEESIGESTEVDCCCIHSHSRLVPGARSGCAAREFPF